MWKYFPIDESRSGEILGYARSSVGIKGTTDAKVTATVETGVKGESFTISGLTGTFSDKNVGSSKTVTVDPSHANATAGANTVVTNYTVSYPQTAEADITPCPVELTWSDTDLIYNGTEQSVTATVINAAKGDSFALTYEGNTETDVYKRQTVHILILDAAFGTDCLKTSFQMRYSIINLSLIHI